MLTFNLTAGKLTRIDSYKTATESSGYPECLFNLYDDWTGANVTARFSTDDEVAYDVLLVDGKCTIPYEVMKCDHFFVSCKGTLSSVVVTTNRVRINNEYSAFELQPANTGAQTPDVISQLSSQITALQGAVGSPLVARTVADMTDTTKIYVYTGSEAGYTSGNWYYYNGSLWVSGGVYNAVAVSTDTTLSVSGMAADAEAVGDTIGLLSALQTTDKSSVVGAINEVRGSSSGLTDDIKEALLACFEKVAWIDEHAQDYYDALESALYPPANLTSITCVYTQSGTVYDNQTLDSLKSDLVVTAHYDNGTSEVVTNYTLSGTLTEGTNTITVAYGGKTATFTVTVTEAPEVPLYPLPNASYSSAGNIFAITDGNHVEFTSTTNSKTLYVFSDATVSTAKNANKATMFTLHEGDAYEFKIKNITFDANTTTSTTSTNNYFDASLRTGDDTAAVTSGPIYFAPNHEASGTYEDLTITGTIESDLAVNAFRVLQYRAVTLSYDVELRVNEVRYI